MNGLPLVGEDNPAESITPLFKTGELVEAGAGGSE
jgi:hypothetical protein